MKADLHIHTVYSGDADQTTRQVLERVRDRGLGAVAIADHNSLGGTREALEIDPDIIVLPAIEVTSSQGHILAYNVTKEVERDLSALETIVLIHENRGIAVAAHPYRLWSGLGGRVVREAGFDAIEARNGQSLEGGNRRAFDLARELGLPVTGGSDAHTQERIGKAFTVFPDDCRSADDLVRAILEGRTELGGSSRPLSSSFAYGRKCIGLWLHRGMKRL